MAEKGQEQRRPAVKTTGSLSHAGIRHTVEQYRLPLVVVTIGILLSILGFIAALNSQTARMTNSFMRSAMQQAALIDSRFFLFEEKVRGVLSLLDTAPRVNARTLTSFAGPMIDRVGFAAVIWVPGRKYGGDMIGVPSKKIRFQANLLSILSAPELKRTLSKAQDSLQIAISKPFSYPEALTIPLEALVIPLVRNGEWHGSVVGLVPLSQIYDSAPLTSLQPDRATLYLFENAASGQSIYEFGSAPPVFSQAAPTWQDKVRHAAFSYRKNLSKAYGQRSLAFVPTASYMMGGLGVLPFFVIFSGLALTSLVGIIVFLQTRQRLVVSAQVEDKTRQLLQIAKSLAENENKLRAIVDHTIDGLITIDSAGTIESFNTACERIFGYTAKEVIGRNINLLMPEPYHSSHNSYISDYLAMGKAKIIGTSGRELTARRKNGSIVPIDLSISTFEIDGKKYFSGIIRDITYEKEAEEVREHYMRELESSNRLLEEKTQLLRITMRTLAESENKLRAIVDHTIDGLITINTSGIVESFNAACEHVFGYRSEEVIGRNINMLMPEPYHSQHNTYISKYLTTGEAQIIGTSGRELTGRRKDGSLVPIELSVSAFDVEGQKYFSGIIRDITRRKQAEKDKEAYLKELETSNRELDDFAYIASHDLKEPLRGLQNFSKFLLEDYADKMDVDGKSKLLTISDLTKRMEDCLNALLHYSRLGRTALAVKETDLNMLVQSVVSLFSITLKEKNTEVVVLQKLPSVVCDHVRIAEVFQNLIGNALKYNDKPENRIEIGCIEDHPQHAGQRVFFVRDHGIGIKQEYLETIFKIFKRLHAKNAYGGGTGSGLTIAKKIINQHGGHMWAESEGEGKGTTFLFTIPQGGQKQS